MKYRYMTQSMHLINIYDTLLKLCRVCDEYLMKYKDKSFMWLSSVAPTAFISFPTIDLYPQ
jgi:hypothetical protein